MMVSFSTTEAENQEGRASRTTQITSSEPSQYTKDARYLFRMARSNDWDGLEHNLKSSSFEVLRNAVDDAYSTAGDEESNSLLHVLVTCSDVPVTIVRTILTKSPTSPSSALEGSTLPKEDSTSLATIQNHAKQTPLHTTLHVVPERTDIVDCLVRAAPETVRCRDVLRVRPIDILCQKIIMMEEVIKYSHHHREEEKGMLNCLWETVRVLAQAACSNDGEESPSRNLMQPHEQQQPILHACLLGRDFPFALKERAMKRYRSQLKHTNANGDLPLHIISRLPPPKRVEEDDEDDFEGDFLERILSLYPAAAAVCNQEGQIPLVLATKNGRRWNSGVSLLLEAHPFGVEDLQLPLQLYPMLFERLQKDGRTCTLFHLIQAKPELFMQRQNV